jgi:hypothetical protein
MGFTRRAMLTLSSLLCLALHVSAAPGAVHEDVPAAIDPSARYLIYLHGRIVEMQGRQAVSPEFGRYEYDAILQALASKGLVVISEVRGTDTGPAYAKKVAGQVRKLLAAGVPANHVTVAGFSKGALLARAASAELGKPDVRFVIMAGCGPRAAQSIKAGALKGRILSLYDQADAMAGSCRPLFATAPGLESKEVRLTIGMGHGVFFTPRKEWIDLVADWALRP